MHRPGSEGIANNHALARGPLMLARRARFLFEEFSGSDENFASENLETIATMLCCLFGWAAALFPQSRRRDSKSRADEKRSVLNVEEDVMGGNEEAVRRWFAIQNL
jgi:hypothetical protein